MPRILAVATLIAGWTVADALTPSAVLLAVATVAVALLVAAAASRPATIRTAGTTACRTAPRTEAATVPRLRDPDADGRPRPRAPSARAGAALPGPFRMS